MPERRFGLYVIESMASGVPVVQPRHAAFSRVDRTHLVAGFMRRPGDPEALAAALGPYLLDPARVRALGEAGRKSVREQFNAEHMARETAKVYQEFAR